MFLVRGVLLLPFVGVSWLFSAFYTAAFLLDPSAVNFVCMWDSSCSGVVASSRDLISDKTADCMQIWFSSQILLFLAYWEYSTPSNACRHLFPYYTVICWKTKGQVIEDALWWFFLIVDCTFFKQMLGYLRYKNSSSSKLASSVGWLVHGVRLPLSLAWKFIYLDLKISLPRSYCKLPSCMTTSVPLILTSVWTSGLLWNCRCRFSWIEHSEGKRG